MTKEEHINYWIKSSEQDWDVVMTLYDQKKYVYSLFFVHLSIEKLAKGLWVKYNEDNYPPRIHNIVRILSSTNLNVPSEDLAFLERLNEFQIESRYPDYSLNIHKIVDRQFTSELINKAKEIRKWLIKKVH